MGSEGTVSMLCRKKENQGAGSPPITSAEFTEELQRHQALVSWNYGMVKPLIKQLHR